MKKIGNVLSCLLPFLIAIIMQVGIGVVAVIVYGIILGVKLALSGVTDEYMIAESMTELMNENFLLAVTIFTGICCIILFGLWYKRSYTKVNRVPLKEVFAGKTVIWIILMGVGLQVGTALLLYFVEFHKPEWFESYNELMQQLGGGNSLLSFIAIVIIAPISEELIFRGVIFEKCKKVMPFLAANIFQALLFGIMHFNLIQGLYAFVLGILIGFVCNKRTSIIAAIMLHMIFNLSSIVLDVVLPVELLEMPIILVVIFCASLVVIWFSTLKISRDNINLIDSEMV